MKKTAIDMASYPRKAHFDYFRSLKSPHVGVTADADVTELVRFCREKNVSFYLAFMHAAALAANGVREFRLRIEGDGIVEYDACGTSHTEDAGNGTYCYCTLYHDMPFGEYIGYAEARREVCRRAPSIEEDEDVGGLYFISSLPWIRYSALVQPTDGFADSNPRITWGRYEADFRGRLMMPVSVLCNHALADGAALARFYQNLEKELREIANG